MQRVLMKCGHTTVVTVEGDASVCPICVGITPEAEIVDPIPPHLEGRVAVCAYCHSARESSLDLPFFEYKGDAASAAGKDDSYYCGCRGWD